jgi:hypothetical protein
MATTQVPIYESRVRYPSGTKKKDAYILHPPPDGWHWYILKLEGWLQGIEIV